MSKYKFSNSNISSHVVSYFTLHTSVSHALCEFVEGKSCPLCCLHRHETTGRSTFK